MLLTAKTTFYVTSSNGTSEMSFLAFSNAIKGGLQLEEVELTTDAEHSKRLERKRRARQEVPSLFDMDEDDEMSLNIREIDVPGQSNPEFRRSCPEGCVNDARRVRNLEGIDTRKRPLVLNQA